MGRYLAAPGLHERYPSYRERGFADGRSSAWEAREKEG